MTRSALTTSVRTPSASGRTTYAWQQRDCLAHLALRAGPDAPTLCAGWAVRDLVAHLVLRERRLDAAPGILLPPLGRHTAGVQRRLAAGDFPALVQTLREGPPRWSPLGWGRVHEAVNLVELFVHGEDVRRAQPGWMPVPLAPDHSDALWARVRRMAPMLARRAGAEVALVRAGTSQSVVVHRGRGPRVTVTGGPGDLLLWAYGRTEVALVEVDGDPEVVERVRGRLGL